MAALSNLTPEERVGLGVAVVLHAALVAILLLPETRPAPFEPAERIDVSLATDVGMVATAPDPSANPALSMAPEIGDLAQPEERAETPPPEPVPEPVRQPAPPPRPAPEQPRTAPAPPPPPRPAPRETPPPVQPQAAPPQQARGSRLGNDFLSGTSDATGDSGSPATQAGPAEQAAIGQAINRQLKPHWSPPAGVDVDKLVTRVRFRLNRDGTLSGNPEVIGTEGGNASNRAQINRHQEQAVRAVRLAAPFNLPEQFYSVWRTVTTNFDNRLAQ